MAKHKKKRTTAQTKLETQARVRKKIKNPNTVRDSPGIEAMAANIRRTGQAVPVTTKGKADKRNPLQTVSDRRKKRFANKVKAIDRTEERRVIAQITKMRMARKKRDHARRELERRSAARSRSKP